MRHDSFLAQLTRATSAMSARVAVESIKADTDGNHCKRYFAALVHVILTGKAEIVSTGPKTHYDSFFFRGAIIIFRESPALLV